MFHFPYLESLVRKNDCYRHLFQQSIHWQEATRANMMNLYSDFNRKAISVQEEMSKKQVIDDSMSSQVESKFIHWKKKVQARFRIETKDSKQNTWKSAGESCDMIQEKAVSLGDWKFDIFKSSRLLTKCSICDKEFGNRRLLNQHKTLEHFSQYSHKEFCYLPYFAEPGHFKNSKNRKNEQTECKFCHKWLHGVKESMETYIEGLKTKTKPIEDTKKRGRKPKSMARRVCELCSKILSNRKGLERHMLIHTGEKPFPCDICGKPFRRKDNCVRHKKTAHLFKKPRKPRRRRENNNISSEPAIGNGNTEGYSRAT